jgi:capsular polysaccharide transport system permease protein
MSSSIPIPDSGTAGPALEVLRAPSPETAAPEAPASRDLPTDERTATSRPPSNSPGLLRRLLSWFANNPLFLLTVFLPTSLSTAYFAFLAPDVYVSEARFVIRSPQVKAPTGLSAIIQGTSITRSHDDTFTVHDFMTSRDALRILLERLPLRQAFTTPEPFPLSSFPNFLGDESFEALHRYYQKHVAVSADSSSGISLLAVRAFRPEDAHRINETLLELSEKLINDLNTRARQDLIQFASSEVAHAEQRARTASLALSAYRNEKQVFDPERQSTVQFQQIAKLQDELIASKTQLAQLRDASIQSPQIHALEKRTEILTAEIASETAKIVGAGASLAQKAADYERLSLDKSFAEKSLAAALASLETARNEALRKQLYLERIVSPNLPDRSFEPKRIKSTLEVFLLGLIAWGIGSMLIAGVREHQD